REEEKSKRDGNIKTELLELLFKTIDDLEERDFKRFKAFLSEKHLRGYEPIPKARLENADATEIINQMSQAYDRDGAVRITASILKKMCRIGLVNDMRHTVRDRINLKFLDEDGDKDNS
ncbi:caspase b-like, partial [Alosa alosa]|uniref:caspase b-like n=1 Tax=Alosa alosa TaxID=278164 RepID=UPI002015166D